MPSRKSETSLISGEDDCACAGERVTADRASARERDQTIARRGGVRRGIIVSLRSICKLPPGMKRPRTRAPSWASFMPALAISAMVVGMAPYSAEIRDWIAETLAGRFVRVMGIAFAVVVGAIVVWVVTRVRD